MPAVAMTDHGNLFGAVEFYNAAKAKGIHPVIGCEVYVAQQGHQNGADTNRYNHLVLLCENQEGYRNLINLVSTGYLDGFYYKPRIDKDLLARHSKGLIAMSACLRGDINETLMADKYDEARRLAGEYVDMFGADNFFLEIQDHELEEDKRVMPLVYKLSRETGIPLVATNDAHYLNHDDAPDARDHALHPDRQDDVRCEPHAVHDRAVLHEVARGDAEAVRRCPGCAVAHVGHRAALQRQARKGQGAVPEVRRSAEHTIDTYFEYVARQGFEKRRPRLEAMARAGTAEVRPQRVRRAARSRDQDDSADEVLRLLPGRLGLHPLCADLSTSRSVRAADPPPAVWSATRCRSPISIRCNTGCCSSASSIPSASACPTSTSTSARTGAAR